MGWACRTAAAAIAFSTGWCGAQAPGPDVYGEVLYQIMPIAWRDSDSDPNRFGDFGGLTASLDYLARLGITAIYLNPIFPSDAYHGYQHGDATRLNAWFGTEPQFLAFVAAARERRMKVYLDLVAYGVSRTSVWYESANRNPDSPYDAWLAFTDEANTKSEGYVFKTWNGNTIGFTHWNLDHPGPVELVSSWGRKWLDPDADPTTPNGIHGYRLDHAYARAPEGWGATIDFWRSWARNLRSVNPGVFLFCEPGDWRDYGAALLTPDGFDAVIAKPFEFAAREALESGKAAKLYETMRRTIDAVPAGKTLVAEINDHDSDRIASVLGGSTERCKAAAAILLTQPFPPCIYFGDELGMLGRKADFGSDANDIPLREPFKWKAVAGPPMSEYYRLHEGAFAKRYSRDNDGRSVEEQLDTEGSLLEEYRKLIAARRANPALSRGAYEPLTAENPHIWAFVRRDPADGQAVLVIINLGGEEVRTTIELGGAALTAPRHILGVPAAPPVTASNRAAYPVALPAHAYQILELTGSASPAGR